MKVFSFALDSTRWPGVAKIIEEAGEVLKVFGKIMATGGDVTYFDGSDLRVRLEEELADLCAAITFCLTANRVDSDRLAQEVSRRVAQITSSPIWLAQKRMEGFFYRRWPTLLAVAYCVQVLLILCMDLLPEQSPQKFGEIERAGVEFAAHVHILVQEAKLDGAAIETRADQKLALLQSWSKG